MIRKITITFSVALVGILLTACFALHSGTMVNSASLSQNNFKIIGSVMGQSQTVNILGFGGGLDRDALVYEAKQDMYNSRPLRSGQAYVNITVDFKRAFYIFWNVNKCTINADIVQFLEDKYNKIDTSEFIMKRNPPIVIGKDTLVYIYLEKNGFKLNEKVDFFNANTGILDEGKIIELNDKGAFIQYSDHVTVDKLDSRFLVLYDKIKKKK